MANEPFRFLGGAGLAGGSAWWNINPPAASNPNPPAASGAASNPNPPAPSGSNSNINPPRPRVLPGDTPAWPLPTLAPPPRVGLDPDWVYDNDQTLLAQALRRSRARIVRDTDGPLSPALRERAALKGRPLRGTQLWRWASEFRIKAVAGELSGRTQVVATQVWLLEPVGTSGAASTARATPLFKPVPTNRAGVPDLSGIAWDVQIDKTLRAATEREDRLPEILSQMDGFWPFYESLTGIPLDRTPALVDLLGATHAWMTDLLMLMKHQVAALRPFQQSSLLAPLIPTPGHGSLPSGHATLSAFTSELLTLLLYDNPKLALRNSALDAQRADQLDALARRIAFNRVVAGVHFPVDSQVGYLLGHQMAHVVAALAGHLPHLPVALQPTDVLAKPLELREADARPAGPAPDPATHTAVATDVATLWNEAVAELSRVRV